MKVGAAWRRAVAEPRPRVGEGIRRRQEHVLADERERAIGADRAAVPVVVPVEGGPVVDEPELAAPPQQVRVLDRPVDVHHEGVEGDDQRGQRARHRDPGRGVEADGAGEVGDAQVQPGAPGEQVADLGIALGAPERGVDVERDQLRNAQADRARQRAGDDLRDERGGPLPGPRELRDVELAVIGLHDRWQRPTLAQRRAVPDGGSGGQRGHA